eukprot:GSMAST32.ASY1.ANO1.1951.1 assembled CDS
MALDNPDNVDKLSVKSLASLLSHVSCDFSGSTSVIDPIDVVNDVSYWQKLCPELHVYGYFQTSRLPWVGNTAALARSIVTLMQHGWPATFILLYDESWAMAREVSELIAFTSGGNQNNFDFLAWYIDPNKGHKGFSPHRDRQPEDLPNSFRKNGSPKYSTCWIPLTDACPDNSCLYVIPRQFDPGYGPEEGDLPNDDDPDPLQRALHNKEAYQNIKALPATAGSAVMFSHRIIHWGSAGRKGYHTPRIAFSFAASDMNYEHPYFDVGAFKNSENLIFPNFIGHRLALASGQMVAYYDRFQFTVKHLQFFYRLFSDSRTSQIPNNPNSKIFHKSYVKKVVKEFVAATQEAVEDSDCNNVHRGTESGEDAMDEAMDALLDAEMAGMDDFHDDFDELESVPNFVPNEKNEKNPRSAEELAKSPLLPTTGGEVKRSVKRRKIYYE